MGCSLCLRKDVGGILLALDLDSPSLVFVGCDSTVTCMVSFYFRGVDYK